jgi:hypothetical protein
VSDRSLTRRVPGAALLVWATLTGVAHTALATAPPGLAIQAPAPDVAPSDDLTWGIRPAGPAGGTARPAFSYELSPGEVVDDAVRVSNFSESPLTLRISAHDAFNTDTGGFDLLPAGADSVDAGSWVTLAADEVTIPAGEQLDVPFRVSVPSNAAPGDHAGGVVASMTVEQLGRDGTAVSVDHRVGTRIYVRVSGPIRPALVVTQLVTRYEPEGLLGLGGAAVTTYTVRNAGNVRLGGDQRLEISGVLGLASREAVVESLPELLPGSEYTTSVTVEGVRSAIRLSSELTLIPSDPSDPSASGSEPDPIVASAAVWAVPWRAVVLLGGAMALLVWFRRRRIAGPPAAPSHPAAVHAPAREDEAAPFEDAQPTS